MDIHLLGSRNGFEVEGVGAFWNQPAQFEWLRD
jgi:hypothetical protein